jgi:hypothetical protein
MVALRMNVFALKIALGLFFGNPTRLALILSQRDVRDQNVPQELILGRKDTYYSIVSVFSST